MSQNLGQLRTTLQAHGYATDTAAVQTSLINTVYRRVCGKRRWPFLEKQNATINTVAGTPNYSLATITDLRNIDAVRIETVSGASDFLTLEYKEPQDFRDMEHVDRDPGWPYFWTYINQQLRFYPWPDQAYLVTIDYSMFPADLASDTDVPVIPSEYQDVLVWGAIAALAYRERDWLGRQFADQQYQMRLKEMEDEYLVNQRQTSSHVKSSGYWDVRRPVPSTNQGGW